MSIPARPSETFTALAQGLAPGLVGTITFGVRRVRPIPSTLILPEVTTGIEEDPQDTDPPTSNYLATRTMPADAGASGSLVEYATAWPPELVEEQETIEVGPAIVTSVVPSLDEVAQLLNAYIVDDGNNYLAGWDDTTTPTDVQVEAKIDRAARDVRRDVGAVLDTTDDSGLLAQARDLASIRAAMYVTESFAPQDTSADGDTYPLLKRLYDEGIRALRRRGGAGSITLVSPYSGDDAATSRLDFNFS